MGITTVIGNQSKSNDIEEFGSASASATGIRKTVVVSTHVDTWDRNELEQFSV
jgi:hypothetical protein